MIHLRRGRGVGFVRRGLVLIMEVWHRNFGSRQELIEESLRTFGRATAFGNSVEKSKIKGGMRNVRALRLQSVRRKQCQGYVILYQEVKS